MVQFSQKSLSTSFKREKHKVAKKISKQFKYLLIMKFPYLPSLNRIKFDQPIGSDSWLVKFPVILNLD